MCFVYHHENFMGVAKWGSACAPIPEESNSILCYFMLSVLYYENLMGVAKWGSARAYNPVVSNSLVHYVSCEQVRECRSCSSIHHHWDNLQRHCTAFRGNS